MLGRDSLGVWNVRFADAVIVSTYGIDPVTRHITRFSVTSRKQGLQSHMAIIPRQSSAAVR